MTHPPDARAQAMPFERAILWNPATQGARVSGRVPYPIFFQQEAVVALQDHVKASPQQAIFGFLAGDLFRDPETGVLYAVIDKTLRLNQAIYGDKTDVVVARLWDRMLEQLARAPGGGRVLGWYHSHPGQALALSPHDVETHQKYFTEPWQVALVVGVEAGEGGGPAGAFFRSGATPEWAETPLPFYELLNADSIRPDGKKRSFIPWKNHKAFNPAGGKRRPSGEQPAAPAAPAAPVFVPTEPAPAPRPAPRPQPPQHPQPPSRPSPPPRPQPPPPPRPSGKQPAVRVSRPSGAPRRTPAPSFRLLDQSARRSRRGLWLTVLAVLLIGGGAAAAGYWYVFLRQPGTGFASLFRRTPPPPALPAFDTALARFDALSDTLAQAVRNYQERATLFANGQMACAGLARGLVVVESLSIVYTRDRRGVMGTLDAMRFTRDQTISAGVDSVESRFDRSRCRRP